jgi:cardiolipin synthase
METNFEINAFIYDRDFTMQLMEYYQKDLRDSREIIYSEWKKRPWTSRMKESLAHLISPMY